MSDSTTMSGSPYADFLKVREIRDWIHQRLGIHYPDDKLEILGMRLDRLVAAERLGSIAELHQKVVVEHRAELYQALAQCASTNHTHFFRELGVLEVFRDAILPHLDGKGEVRLWCAAVSSGQEAYTLAMMLAERLGLEAARQRFTILGTDISQAVLTQAENGVYGRRAVSDIPPELQRRYLRPRGLGQYAVVPELREMCVFRRLNLKSAPWPFQRRFHVVFLRNVLYYFDQAEQRAVLGRVFENTAQDGWLLTSTTESLRGLETPWATVAPGVHSARFAPALGARLGVVG